MTGYLARYPVLPKSTFLWVTSAIIVLYLYQWGRRAKTGGSFWRAGKGINFAAFIQDLSKFAQPYLFNDHDKNQGSRVLWPVHRRGFQNVNWNRNRSRPVSHSLNDLAFGLVRCLLTPHISCSCDNVSPICYFMAVIVSVNDVTCTSNLTYALKLTCTLITFYSSRCYIDQLRNIEISMLGRSN